MHSRAQPVVLIAVLLLVGKPVLLVLAAPKLVVLQLAVHVGQLLELVELVVCSYWPKYLVQRQSQQLKPVYLF
jgi:hypothetical protein